jgi:hypothetical protein
MDKEKASKKTLEENRESILKRLLEVDGFLIEKLYIVQVASVEGWKFANSVDFYQSGMKAD